MKICFVVSSIGSEDTQKRKKADALLEHVIKPVLESLDYEVIRADSITAPNSINRGVIEHLEKADLVVADVHDRNPNVFYELGIRNVVEKPYILFKKQGEQMPFDIQGKRGINHPFSEIDSEESSEEIYQKYEKKIEKAKKALTKFTIASEQNFVDASESITSLYLDMGKKIKTLEGSLDSTRLDFKKQKKNLKFYVITSSIIIFGILSFLTFNIMEHDTTIQNMKDEHAVKLKEMEINKWKEDLNQQSEQIESDIYNHIDMIVFATTDFETQLKYMYDYGPKILGSTDKPTPAEFIEGIREHGNFVGQFEKKYMTTPLSSYLYLHEHGDPCKFVAYGYLDKMKRDGFVGDVPVEGIGRGLQSCVLMDDYDLIIADIHASTGTIDYSFPVVRNVDLIPNDSKTDMVIATSIDLVRFSEQIRSSIYLDDVRFVLENKYSQVVFDCMKDKCDLDYKTRAVGEDKEGLFNKHSQPLRYNSGDFPEYEEYDTIALDNANLVNIPKNAILLEEWMLHVLLPKDDPAHDK